MNKARRFGPTILLCVLCVTFLCLWPLPASPTDATSEDDAKNPFGAASTDFSSVSLDLALIQKISADEAFIRGGVCKEGSLPESVSIIRSHTEYGYCDALQEFEKSAEKKEDPCPIALKYCDALQNVGKTVPDALTPAKRNTRELLRRDIKYRLLLLDQRLSFWGGARSLTPSIPIQHVRAMDSLLGDVEKQVLEMLDFLSKIADDAESANRLKAYAEQVRGQFRSASVEETKAEIIRIENRRRERLLDSRVEGLEKQRQRLEQEAEALRNEAEQLSNAAEKAVLNAVVSSMGVPPGLVDAAQEGDIKKAALSALDIPAVKEDIGDIVKSFGDSTQQLVDLYQQGEELHRQFEEGKDTLRLAKDFLRKPSADKLLRLGSAVGDYLPEPQRQELQKVVDEAAPVLSLVDTVRTLHGKSPADICRALASNTLVTDALDIEDKAACGLLDLTLPKACENPKESCKKFGLGEQDGGLCKALLQGCSIQDSLAEHINLIDDEFAALTAEIESAVIGVIDDAGDRYEEVFTDAMRRINEVTLDSRELDIALHEVTRLWSRDAVDFVLDRVPAARRDAAMELLAKQLRLDLGDGDEGDKRQKLADALSLRGLDAALGDKPVLKLANGRLSLTDPVNGELMSADASKLLRKLDPKRLESKVTGPLKDNVKGVMRRLSRERGKLRQALLRHVSPEKTEKLLQADIARRAESSGSKEAARQEIWQRVSGGNEDVRKFGQNLIIGRTVAVDIREELPLPKAPPVAPTAEPPPADGPSIEQVLTEQAIKAALNAAFPGAGVALDVFQNLAAVNANIDRQKEIGRESVRIALLMIEAQETADVALYQSILAEKDRELAAALRQAASRQLETYSFGIKQNVRNAALARSKVKLRRALTFYAAERLREEFDLFNRSMGLWAGYLNQPSDAVVQMIKSDPRNLRLALDPQIHLFGWLERQGEATRTDVDRLMLHWRQLVRLSKDLCQTRGCTPGAGRLGQAAQTKLLRLTELVPQSEVARFRRWQEGSSNEPFRTRVLVHPAFEGFPPAYRNLRFIDLRAGWLDPDGQLRVPSGMTIRHPGTATVAGASIDDPDQVKFTRETMLPRRTSSFDVPHPFDLEQLRNRWANDNDREPGLLEGYGLYTTLEVQIFPTVEARGAVDLGLRIAFAYTDPENVVTESDFVNRLARSTLTEGLKINPYVYTLCVTKPTDGKLECSDNERLRVPTIAALMIRDGKSRPSRERLLNELRNDRATAPGESSTTTVTLKQCNRSWASMRTELRAYVTAEEMDRIEQRLGTDERARAKYAALQELQLSLDKEVARQEDLLATEFKRKKVEDDMYFEGCPHPTERLVDETT